MTFGIAAILQTFKLAMRLGGGGPYDCRALCFYGAYAVRFLFVGAAQFRVRALDKSESEIRKFRVW